MKLGLNLKQESSVKELKKEFIYKNPNVKIGNGKLGPVELIIVNNELMALKRIRKMAIDKPKRIQHLKNEKNLLLMLKKIQSDMKVGKVTDLAVYLEDSKYELDNRTQDTSQRGSYLIDDSDSPPLPLNYIVHLENTFSDLENVNYVFEYLPGQDLYWVIKNQQNNYGTKDEKKNWIKFYSS